jgi:hypothetical protein
MGTGKVIPLRKTWFELSRSVKTGNSNILKMWLPAELPAIISATRSQQFRWKGGAENFSKMPLAYSNQSLLIEKKRMACFIYWIAPCFGDFHDGSLKRTMLYITKWVCHIRKVFDLLIFLSSLPSSFISYWATFKSIHGGGFKNFLTHYFIYYLLYHSMGFSFHNTIAVLEGLWGKKIYQNWILRNLRQVETEYHLSQLFKMTLKEYLSISFCNV